MSTPRGSGRTLVDLLEHAAEVRSSGLRFVDRLERATWYPWGELVERALVVCGGLRRLGVAPGDRVALVFPTSVELFDAFFGVLLAGGVPVPLYPPVRLGRLEEYSARTASMLRAAGARLVLADGRVRRLLGPAVAAVGPELGCLTLAEVPHGIGEPVDADEDRLAMVQYSSGTTVEPKPVALTHRAVMAQVERLNGFWPDRDGLVHSGVSWLPLYHDMGLIGCVLPALERPGMLTLIPPDLFVARPEVWLRTISRYKATLSPAPNFAFGLCVDRISDEAMDGVDLSCWRVALDGAEPIAPRVLRAFIDRFARWGLSAEAITPVYGLSEASLAVTFSDLEQRFTSERFDREHLARDGRAVLDEQGVELVSVGRPLPGFELRILDRDGCELPECRLGRISVRGPSLMSGYLGREADTAAALAGGWLDTGDLGFVSDGELYLTGRTKDVLILRGRNHSPHEVEHAVDHIEGVRKGCAVAVSWLDEEADGEQLLVLIEARRRVEAARYPELARRCGEAIRAATGLGADRVEILAPGTLPRTSSGKLRRREALRRWKEHRLDPPARVTALGLAAAIVRSKVALVRSRGVVRHGS